MTLNEAQLEKEYVIESIEADDDELESFLFTLGCYEGATVTVVTRKKNNCVVSIKDARYNIDNNLASVIYVA